MTAITPAALTAAAMAVKAALERDHTPDSVAAAALHAAEPHVREAVIEEALGQRPSGDIHRALNVAITRYSRTHGGLPRWLRKW